ncbi:hypothetical protein P9847_09040 [Paenibacillus chibensis]|uniref:Chromosome segregation ATPase n=1 Tax=Paenibacillus chibensis TaxID=59846 RepID=A0ABU6PRF2_9BACL|nr:hypothetical protein [Paenibacillus chibensis]
MSGIQAVRLTNVQYNKQQFVMDNLFLDLANETDLVHALLTFPNGYGKGVILQMIFQIFKPLTKWQGGKGRVSQLFHTASGGFRPYTVYTALEWKLDGTEERHLVTGIAITARRVKEADGEKMKTDTPFKLFTVLCGSNSEHRLAKLPYWDEEAGETWTLERWEEYAREFPQHIRLYGEGDLRKYRSFLEDYGIFSDEWEEMYKINQNEAGTSVHFEKLGAGHNDGLFRNVIIPSIEANMRKQGSRENVTNLKELFIEVAKIAYNLNTLLARKAAMIGLLEMLRDAEGVYQSLDLAERDVQSHLDKGGDLKSALRERIEEAEQDLRTLNTEWESAQASQKDARFQLKNLIYVEKQYELLHVRVRLEETRAEATRQKDAAQEQKKGIYAAERDILRKDFENVTAILDATVAELAALMMREKITDVKREQEEMVSTIQKEWPQLLSRVRHAASEALGYQEMLQSHVESAEKAQKKAYEEQNQIGMEIGGVKERIRSFEEKRKHGLKEYGIHDQYALQRLKEDKHLEANALIERMAGAEEKAAEIAEETILVGEKRGKAESAVEYAKTQVKALEDAYERQLKLEVEAAALLVSFSPTPLPWHEERYASWMEEELPEVIAENTRMADAVHRETEELRRLQNESMITDGGVWVPNTTILEVRDTIKRYGFTCLLGTEYLDERSEEEQGRLQGSVKLLPYGLVILRNEQEKIQNLTTFRKRVLFHPVPLFVIEHLEDAATPIFVTVPNRGEEIGFSSDALESYRKETAAEIQKRSVQLAEVEQLLKQRKEGVRRAQIALGSDKRAEALNEECNRSEEAAAYARKRYKELSDRLSELQSSAQIAREELQVLLTSHKQAETSFLELAALDEAWENFLVDEAHLKELENKDRRASQHINEILEAKKRAESDVREQKSIYDDWRRGWGTSFQPFREAFPDLEDIGGVDPSSNIFPPEVYPVVPSFLLDAMTRWKACQRTLEQANTEIAILEERKTNASKQLNDMRHKLVNHDPAWQSHAAPMETKEVLESRRDRCRVLYEQADELRQDAEKEVQGLLVSEMTIIERCDELNQEIIKDFGREVEYKSGIIIKEKRAEWEWKLSNASSRVSSVKSNLDVMTEKKRARSEAYDRLPIAECSRRASRELYEKVGVDSKSEVDRWLDSERSLRDAVTTKRNGCIQRVLQIQRKIKQTSWDAETKENGDALFDSIRELETAEMAIQKISDAIFIYDGVLQHEETNLSIAQEAEQRWVQTATEHSRQIISHIGEMVKGMSIRNRYGYSFPLMKLKNDSPIRIEDMESRMESLFRQTLGFVEKKGLDLNSLQKSDLGDRLDAGSIVYAAYQFVFPTMLVYNMNVDNAFWVDRPLEKYFTEWEVFLQGSDEEATGSGGQRLAAFTLLSIMLTTQKRRRNKVSKRSVFINDNPFANAISEHVLDPIFRVADALGVQWIVVAPPELVSKMEVSERFPSYYGLDLEPDRTGKHKVVIASRHLRDPLEKKIF